MTAADHIHKYYFHCFSEKIRLDISCESPARQRIHMKQQALFSSKDKRINKQMKQIMKPRIVKMYFLTFLLRFLMNG